MTRAVVTMVMALSLSGCFLDGAGLREPDGAAPVDAFVPPLVDGGRMDAFVPPMDAGTPPDAGGDTGVEVVDAFVPPDTGPPDSGPPDTGPPDAGPPPPACDVLYPSFSPACPALAGPAQCAFYYDPTGASSCETACGLAGNCAGAYSEGSSESRCDVPSVPDENCGENYFDIVCVCDILP